MKQKTPFKQTEIGEIPEDWKAVELGTVSDFQYGLGESAQDNGEFIYIRITDITADGFLKKEGLVFIGKEKVGEKYVLNKGDVLVARTGASFGKTYQFKEDFKASYGGFLIKFLFNKKQINNDFYFQFSRSKLYWDQANNLVGGGAQPQFNANVLSKMIIPCPHLSEQENIAKILSDLDSQIEVLQQQNKTLEVIGQALFKHWFVDFEFPNEKGKPYKSSGGEMVESELGDVPKGWTIKPIDEIAEFLNGLPLQKYPAESEEQYLPVVKIRELKQGITESSDKASINVPEKYVVNDGDVLFSWSGSLEVVIWAYGKGALNQHLFKVSSKDYPKWFYYYWILRHLPEYRLIAEGKATTMGHIQRHHLKESLVLIPSEWLMQKLNNILQPLFNKVIGTMIETRTILEIRDSLLPKLMSGKLRTHIGGL